MMKSGCHKCDSLTVLLCVKPVIKVLLRNHRHKIYPQRGRVHHGRATMTSRHICPRRLQGEVWRTVNAEPELPSGLLSLQLQNNIKRNIKLF